MRLIDTAPCHLTQRHHLLLLKDNLISDLLVPRCVSKQKHRRGSKYFDFYCELHHILWDPGGESNKHQTKLY
jgi:hypothetical protein